MEERLRNILTLTNDWLKFAETKNAGLLVFSGAAIIGAHRSTATETPTPLIQWTLTVGAALLLIAAILCLLSFLPTIRVPLLESKRAPAQDDNLLFYGHIAAYRPTEYLAKLQAATNTATTTAMDEQFAQQIVTNAQIAVRKYRHFSAAAWLAVPGGILSLGVTPILQLWKC
jgi:hypothetical protein